MGQVVAAVAILCGAVVLLPGCSLISLAWCDTLPIKHGSIQGTWQGNHARIQCDDGYVPRGGKVMCNAITRTCFAELGLDNASDNFKQCAYKRGEMDCNKTIIFGADPKASLRYLKGAHHMVQHQEEEPLECEEQSGPLDAKCVIDVNGTGVSSEVLDSVLVNAPNLSARRVLAGLTNNL